MASQLSISYRGQTWAQLVVESVQGVGRVLPRLVVQLAARPYAADMLVQLTDLDARLMLGSELLSLGSLEQRDVVLYQQGITVTVASPLSPSAIDFIDSHFRRADISLQIEWRGTMRAQRRDEGSEPEPAPERWPLISVDHGPGAGSLTIARSDWVTKVLQPVGVGEYVLMDVPIPAAPDRDRWNRALHHLAEAERFFHMGDDEQVLQLCYGAFESLADDPTHIFDGVHDERQREKLDSLLRQFKAFLHGGRHVSKEGQFEGAYPVDHRDAEFSLGVSKVFLAYIAKLLARH